MKNLKCTLLANWDVHQHIEHHVNNGYEISFLMQPVKKDNITGEHYLITQSAYPKDFQGKTITEKETRVIGKGSIEECRQDMKLLYEKVANPSKQSECEDKIPDEENTDIQKIRKSLSCIHFYIGVGFLAIITMMGFIISLLLDILNQL